MFSDKTKAYVGNICLQVMVWLVPFHFYLIYLAFHNLNPYLIAYLVFLQVYGSFFCKRNEYYVKLGLWFKLSHIFKEWKILQEEPTPKEGCLFSFHPHGIYNWGTTLNLNQPGTIFENLVVLGSRVALNTIFMAIPLKLWGVQGVNASNLKRLLKERKNCGLLPGGFEEATLTTKREDRVFIRQRKGFIKYALQFGTTVYPVYTFGENQLFYTFDKLTNLRLWLNKFKLIGTVFWSRFGTLPEPDTTLVTVIGKGIKLPIINEPTPEEVNKYHELYIRELIQLYDRYQPTYAPKMKLKVF